VLADRSVIEDPERKGAEGDEGMRMGKGDKDVGRNKGIEEKSDGWGDDLQTWKRRIWGSSENSSLPREL
jgi:hypothetical protein